MKSRSLIALLFLTSTGLFACGPKANYIGNTKIAQNEENNSVVDRIEQYRSAVEKQDAAALLLMASREYWEDSGTPIGEDDYGFAGLKELLATRFGHADSIRYAMRYMRIRYMGEAESRRAFVDVLVDASFTLPDAHGGVRRADKRDQNQFVLQWNGEKWMFLSGM